MNDKEISGSIQTLHMITYQSLMIIFSILLIFNQKVFFLHIMLLQTYNEQH